MENVARCSCGAAKVIVQGEPVAVVACHCLACQRRSGSVFGVGAYYAPADVSVTGALTSYTRPSEPDGSITFKFCPVCGTTLVWQVDGETDRTGVAVGAFGDPSFATPVRSVWEQSRHGWVNVDGIRDHFEKGRA